MYIIHENTKGLFLYFYFFQNIGDIDMDFGDAQKECINKGSEAVTLKGAENSPSFSQQNDVEAVISHKKSKKDANLNVTAHVFFSMLLSIFPLSYCLIHSFLYHADRLCLYTLLIFHLVIILHYK